MAGNKLEGFDGGADANAAVGLFNDSRHFPLAPHPIRFPRENGREPKFTFDSVSNGPFAANGKEHPPVTDVLRFCLERGSGRPIAPTALADGATAFESIPAGNPLVYFAWIRLRKIGHWAAQRPSL